MNTDWIFQKEKNPKRIFSSLPNQQSTSASSEECKSHPGDKSLRGKPSGLSWVFYHLFFVAVFCVDVRRFVCPRLLNGKNENRLLWELFSVFQWFYLIRACLVERESYLGGKRLSLWRVCRFVAYSPGEENGEF